MSRHPRGTERDGRRGPHERAAEDDRHLYGINPVLEALRARPDQLERLLVAEGHLSASAAAEILSRARDGGVKVERVPRERLNGLTAGGVHQGVVARVRTFEYATVEDILAVAASSGRPPLVVVLDGIQDPHNLGAIIRSAHALGAHGVIIAQDRAAQVTGAVAKASAGAVEHCAVARVTNVRRALEELKEAGLWVAAADPGGTVTLPEASLDGPLALVVGAEGPGVRKGVLDACDHRVRIPMLGKVASLNASVSAALLLYEVLCQRQMKEGA
jgi:23S rRNA (guanosine2251-2'-O)-methyltransferase